MAQADFYFDAELNHFLAPHKKGKTIAHFFEERTSIKDMIEGLGIPHPEVDYIEVNGQSVDFSYIVQDGDRVQVYPFSSTPEVTLSVSVRPHPLDVIRFVLDIHLGKLATSLRLLGFDTLYRNDYADEELAYISSSENRILLTRDKGLLMRSQVTYGYYVRNTDPPQQIVEVMQRFDLFELVKPWQRCLRCNGLLQPVSKESVLEQLPPNVAATLDKFHRCNQCYQIYWRGSHYERMQQFIDSVLNSKTNH